MSATGVYEDLFGKTVIDKKNELPVSSLDKKYLGLYFSAHWCPPCQRFTPVLAKWYTEMKSTHPELEIVFVSSDKDQEHFDSYYASMPWLALPFAARETKAKISEKFGVNGIPCLIFLKDGKIQTKLGREYVSEEGQQKNFPWFDRPFWQVFGEHIEDNEGKKIVVADLQKRSALGLFVASPDTKVDIKALTENYKKIKAKDPQAEIVFIPSSADESKSNEFAKTLPFPIVKWASDCNSIADKLEVWGTGLVVIDPSKTTNDSISFVNKNALKKATSDGEWPFLPSFVWSLDDEGCMDDLNSKAMFMLVGAQDKDSSVFEKTAEELKSKLDTKKYGFAWGNDDMDFVDNVRRFLKLKTGSVLVMADIKAKVKHICAEKFSEQALKTFVEAASSGSLKNDW